MLLLAGGVILAGYTLVYWGVTQLQGCTNVGLEQVIWPGKWQGCNAAKSGAAPAAPAAPAGSKTPPKTTKTSAGLGGSGTRQVL